MISLRCCGLPTCSLSPISALCRDRVSIPALMARRCVRILLNSTFATNTLRRSALGGRRGRQHSADPDANALWDNASFRNFADYALTGSFRSGLAALRELGSTKLTVLMCAEAVWWRCHRRIITDHLLAGGDQVYHLMGRGRIEAASLTPGAQRIEGGSLIYPK